MTCMSADALRIPAQLAQALGVVKTTMANKAGLINRTLDIGIVEPDLTRGVMLEQHPVAWLVEVDGFIADARALPADVQDEARRRGLIPDSRRLAHRMTTAAELDAPSRI
jgi:hypothetical protein